MPKYLSGRVKRTPQGSLTTDRYQFLGLEQTEPNIGDPPEFDPLPSGTQYQIVSFIERPGERFWVPVGGGIIPGSLTLRDEGLIVPRTNANPNLGVNSITDVDFVGAAVSVLGYINPDGSPGTAVTVTISSPGENHGVIFNNNNEFATSPFFTFDNSIGIGSVGIGTSNPTQNLHVVGNVKLDKTIYGEDNQPGNPGDLLVKTVTGGVKWIDNTDIGVGAAGTFTQVQFHDSTGLLGGAPNFVFDFTNNRIGIGSTQPDRLLDVLGESRFTGIATFVDDVVFEKNVSIAGTLTYEDVTNVDAIGIVTARSGIDIDDGGLNVDVGITTFNDDVKFITENGNNIVFDKSLNKLTFGDNVQAMFGDGEDLKIYHDPSNNHSIIQESGSGNLQLRGGNIILKNSNGALNLAHFIPNGASILYFSNNQKFETTNEGILVSGGTTTGTLSVTGFSTFTNTIDANGDLDVDGHTELDDVNISGIATVNDLDVDGHTELDNLNVSGITTFKDDVEFHGVGGISSITFDKSDNSLKFVDDARLKFGNSDNFHIYYGNGNAFIRDIGSGNLFLDTNGTKISLISDGNQATGTMANFFKGGKVELFYDNTLRLSTSGAGVTVHSQLDTSDISLEGDIKHTGNVNTKIRFPQDDTISFDISASEALRINSSGVKIIKNGNLNIDSTYIDFSGDVSTPQTAASIFRPADNTLAFSTANEERLRINSSGNVGIGTDNPLFPLHITRTMGSNPSFIHVGVKGTNAVGGGGGIAFDTSASVSDTTKYIATIAGVRNSLNNGSNDLIFSTTKATVNGDLPLEKLRITSEGNIYTSNDQVRDNARLTVTNSAVGISTVLFLHNSSGSGTASKISSSKGLVLAADVDGNSGASESFIQFDIDGNEQIQINKDGDFIPSQNEQQDLGSSAKRWDVLYIKEVNASGGSIIVDNYETNNLRVTGLSTFVGNAEFQGNVSIGGTLTYEDVTNVDALGIVTARSGVDITSGGLNVVGVSTFDSRILVGDDTFMSTRENGLVEIANSGGGKLVLRRDDTSISNSNSLGVLEVMGNDPNGNEERIGAKIAFSCPSSTSWSDADYPTHISFSNCKDGSGTTSSSLLISGSPGDVKHNVLIGNASGSNMNDYYLGIRGNENTSSGDTTNIVNFGILNQSTSASAQSVIDFRLGQATVSNTTSVRLIAGKRAGWNNTVSTRDGYFAVSVAENATLNERLRIDSAGRVRIANTNFSAAANADDLIIGTTSGNRGLTVVSGNTGIGALFFADDGNQNKGSVVYEHNTDQMRFSVNGNQVMRLDYDSVPKWIYGSDLNTFTSLPAADNIGFTAGGTEKLRIVSDGVGIGTDDPDTDLHVMGQIKVDAPSYARVEYARSGTNLWSVGLRDTDDFWFFRESGSANVIFQHGNVGIGSTIPTRKLDVVGTTHIEGSLNVIGHTELDDLNVSGIGTFDQIFLPDNKKIEFGNVSGSGDLEIYHDSSNNNSYIKESGVGSLFIQGSDLYLTDEDGTNMLYAANNGGVRLYYGGGLKLNTTQEGIYVSGGATFTGNVSIGGTLTYEDVTNVDAVGLITARSGIHVLSEGIIVNASSNNSASTNANDVVIGTISDVNKGISILGNASTGIGRIMFSDGVGSFDQGSIEYRHADDSMRFSTSTSEKLRIDSSGRVLVNTTTTNNGNNKMIIEGPSPSGTYAAYDGQLVLKNSETSGAINTGSALVFFGHDGGNQRGSGAIRCLKENGTSGNHNFYMSFLTRVHNGSNTEKLRITSDGKVGIGSEIPDATLDLQSEDTEVLLRLNTKPTKNGYLDIVSDTNRRGTIRFKDTDGTYRWSIGKGDSDELANTSFFINAGNNGGTNADFVIDSNGKVGIGSAIPAHNLDVRLTGRFNENGAGGHGVLVGGGTNTGGFTYMSSGDMEISCAMTNKDIVFSDAVGGNQRMRLTGDTGRLGIGTVNPQEKLHIADSGHPKILIEDTNGDNQVAVRFKTSTQDWSAGLHGGQSQFKISRSSTFGTNDYVCINNSGDILPGGTSQNLGSNTQKWDIVYANEFIGEINTVQENITTGNLLVTGISTFVGVATFSQIGIGTDPSLFIANDLVVGDGESSRGLTINSDGTTGRILFADGSSGDDRKSGEITYDHSNNTLNFYTNAVSTPRISIKQGGNVEIDRNLDVDGHTDLDDLIVAGVSTHNEGIFIPDNKEAKFGNSAASPDLKIYSDGNNAILFANNKDLYLKGQDVYIQSNNNEASAYFYQNGAVKLYFNGNQRFETTASGVDITDDLKVAGLSTFVGDAQFDGNVSIGGTLTYEDVTNVDSIGIITAREDVHVGAGLSVVGISTFNNKLGVGDTVPNATLEVNGPIKTNKGSYTAPNLVGADTRTDVAMVIPTESAIYVEHEDSNTGVGRYLRNLIKEDTGRIEIGQNGTGIIGEVRVKPGDSGFFSVYNNATETFRVDNGGNVGIGSASPAYALDLGESSSTIRLVSENNGTAIRIGAGSGSNDVTLLRVDGETNNHDGESNNSEFGFSLKYMGARSGNSNSFSLFSDNQQGTQIEAITVLQDGKVGIKDSSPSYELEVNGTVAATNFDSLSDRRYKTNIQVIENPIEKIMKIDGVSFNWKETNQPSLGVIADNIIEVLPEIVSGEDTKSVNYNGLIGLLIETVKDQQKQINKLRDLINK